MWLLIDFLLDGETEGCAVSRFRPRYPNHDYPAEVGLTEYEWTVGRRRNPFLHPPWERR